MTKERELLKEAAETITELKKGCLPCVGRPAHSKADKVLLGINAHLSQPDAVAMTWEQTLDKAAEMGRYKSFKDAPHAVQRDYLYKAAAHLFAEANQVQRCIPVKERLPKENENVLWWKVPVCEPPYVGTMLDENFDSIYYTHWQPLPEGPGVYLEGNK